MTDKSKDYSGAAWELKLAVVTKEHKRVAATVWSDAGDDYLFLRTLQAELYAREDELRAALKRVEELEVAMNKLRDYPWGSSSFMERQAFNAELDELLPQPHGGTTKEKAK